MRILIINPNSDELTDACMKKKAIEFANGKYMVDVAHVTKTPKLVGTYKEMADALPEMIEMVKQDDKYDAYIVACHSDPNLDVLKEISNKPVVGIAEASMKIASMYCNGFAIISPSERSVPKKWTLARKYHCGELYRGAEFAAGFAEENVLEAAKRAVEKYHVDGIVLGCANYSNADRYVEKELGVKVFDGVACSLMIASGMAMYQKYKEEI